MSFNETEHIEDIMIYKNGDRYMVGEAVFYSGDMYDLKPLEADHFDWKVSGSMKGEHNEPVYVLSLGELQKQIMEAKRTKLDFQGRPFNADIVTIFVLRSSVGEIYKFYPENYWTVIGTFID